MSIYYLLDFKPCQNLWLEFILKCEKIKFKLPVTSIKKKQAITIYLELLLSYCI